METALSYVMVLPSTPDEVLRFKRILLSEMKGHPDPENMLRQLLSCHQLFTELLTDGEAYRTLYPLSEK